MTPIELYTLGHSAHPIDKFLLLLKLHNIHTLVDVRSTPASRFHPQFTKRNLESAIQEQGIQYLYMGNELGGRPADPSCYPETPSPRPDKKPHPVPDFRIVMTRDWFQAGIQRLVEVLQHTDGRVAILCSEENPANCHRQHLIAAYLSQTHPEIQVLHIRGDGSLQAALP